VADARVDGVEAAAGELEGRIAGAEIIDVVAGAAGKPVRAIPAV
jgi:hypothetical protein